jgi:hypothetical protein
MNGGVSPDSAPAWQEGTMNRISAPALTMPSASSSPRLLKMMALALGLATMVPVVILISS